MENVVIERNSLQVTLKETYVNYWNLKAKKERKSRAAKKAKVRWKREEKNRKARREKEWQRA